MSYFPKSWGKYPPEYDPAVHGYFYPHRYYGKPDTKFTQVKLEDFPAWFRRRNKSLSGIVGALSRGIWKHHIKWMSPKKPGVAGILHIMSITSLFSYIAVYKELQHHRQYRYH